MNPPWIEFDESGRFEIAQRNDIDGTVDRIVLDEMLFVELTAAMVALTAQRARVKLLASLEQPQESA